MCLLRVKVILLAVLIGYVGAQTGFVQDPVNATVCQDDDVTFTCVLFISSGAAVAPGWRRNGGAADPMRHTIVNNLTNGDQGPVYVSSTITVNSVTAVDDDQALYQCDVFSTFSTNNATLSVVAAPMTAPTITGTTALSSTTFIVNWTITGPGHNYIVTLINSDTDEMDNMTISDNISSYMVNVADFNSNNTVSNYSVIVTANNSCGMIPSEDDTVYDPPEEPQFVQCVSYRNKSALEVSAYVAVASPRMSLSLTFSASYQTGSNSNSSSQSANCSLSSDISLSSDMQYICTAKFAVDIIPSVDTIDSVYVTVSGPYGSSDSSLPNINQSVSSILNVTENVTMTTVTLDCILACMSSLECRLLNITTDGTDAKNITNTTSSITNLPAISYEYPVERITINNLMVNTMYKYCIIAFNTMQVGEPYCDSFNTSGGGDDPTSKGTSEPPIKGINIGAIVGGVVGGVVAVIAVGIGIFVVYMLCCRNKDSIDSDKQELRSPTTTSGSHTASVQPASSVPHQAAASGEEYALTSKVVTKPQQQQPPEEYAMVDKTKKHAAAAQGIHYADLQALPSSGDKPPPNQGPSTYAMVA